VLIQLFWHVPTSGLIKIKNCFILKIQTSVSPKRREIRNQWQRNNQKTQILKNTEFLFTIRNSLRRQAMYV